MKFVRLGNNKLKKLNSLISRFGSGERNKPAKKLKIYSVILENTLLLFGNFIAQKTEKPSLYALPQIDIQGSISRDK